jgi:uncharacterized XkdX family phage protein
MNWYEIAKLYFNWGIYDSDDLKVFLDNEKITAEEYVQITGEDPYKDLPQEDIPAEF